MLLKENTAEQILILKFWDLQKKKEKTARELHTQRGKPGCYFLQFSELFVELNDILLVKLSYPLHSVISSHILENMQVTPYSEELKVAYMRVGRKEESNQKNKKDEKKSGK